MRERGDRPRLALETGEGLVVPVKSLREHLDRNIAQKPRVPGPIHLPHPARTQRRQDLVGPEARAGRERHRYLLSAAVQFRTTVIAGEKLSSAMVAKRKR